MERRGVPANRVRRGFGGMLARWSSAPPADPGASDTVRPAVAAHLLGKGSDVDRLLQIAVETRRQEPVAAPGQGRGAERDDRYPSRFRASAKLACDVRSIHVG